MQRSRVVLKMETDQIIFIISSGLDKELVLGNVLHIYKDGQQELFIASIHYLVTQ
jgi:hypothetical protein